MTRRAYAGAANKVQLLGPINEAALVMNVTPLFGWPSGAPFIVAVGRSTPSEEKILCEAASGGVITVVAGGRGYDGTSQTPHSADDYVEVVFSAIDADEANAHVNATTGVHGLGSGDRVVGRVSVDVLQNKTIDGDQNTVQNLDISSMPDQLVINATLDGRLDQHDIDIAARPTQSSVDSQFVTERTLHYSKVEADVLYDAEEAARQSADNLRYLKTEVYNRTEDDAAHALFLTKAAAVVQPYTPTFLGSGGGGTLGNSTVAGRYQRVGNWISASLDITIGSTASLGTGTLLIGLPVQAAAASPSAAGGGMVIDVSAGAAGRFTVNARLNSVSDILLVVVTTMGIVTGSGTVPMSWAAGDLISLTLQYEASS